MNQQRRRNTAFLLVMLTLSLVTAGLLFTTSAAAQTDIIEEDTVFSDGSTITINTGNSAAIAVDSLPDDVEVNDVSDGGIYDDSEQTIFYPNRAGLPESVSFVLTPGDSYAAGDTISFRIDEGNENSEVQFDVVERDDVNGDETGTRNDGAGDKTSTRFDSNRDLSGSTVWRGQNITVDLNESAGANVAIELRQVDSFGVEGEDSLVYQLATDSNGTVSIETDDLSTGDYFLTGSSGLPARVDALENRVGVFSVTEQTLEASFDAEKRANTGPKTLSNVEFDSNRGRYPITIHASGDLSTDELTDIFQGNLVDPSFNIRYTHEGGNGETSFDEIGLESVSDADDYAVDFSDIDTGSYEFVFIGTDSTATSTDSIEINDVNSNETGTRNDGASDTTDARFDSNRDLSSSTVWRGQKITVDLSSSVRPGQAIELRRVDSFGVDGRDSLADQLATDNNGTVSIETDDLSTGDYFLTGSSGLPTRVDALRNRVGVFSVSNQTLTADFNAKKRTNGGSETLSNVKFDSNRNRYMITIHASGDLNTDELADIFTTRSSLRSQYTAEGNDGETDYDEIGIGPIQDADNYVVDFSGIDTGSYDFSFEGTDSIAKDTESITVRDTNVDAKFAEAVTQDAAGDITSFNLTLTDTDYSYVQIGGEDAGFVDVLYVEADNNSKPIEIEINTRLLGTSAEIDRVYNVDNVDAFESEVHGGIATTPPGESLYEDNGVNLGNDFDAYIDELGIANPGENQIIRPLQPTDYRVTAANAANLNSTTSVFDADTGGEANDRLGSKTIELTQPDIGGITTYTAPKADANAETNISKLLSNATERTEVAAGSRLIVQVEATGIYGALIDGTNKYGANFDRLDDGLSSQVMYELTELNGEQVTFEVVENGPTGNQPSREINLRSGDEDVFILPDEDNEQFFLIANTSSDDAFRNGDRPSSSIDFTATIGYDADNEDERFEFTESQNPYESTLGSANYPYLLQGEAVSSSHDFSFVSENNASDPPDERFEQAPVDPRVAGVVDQNNDGEITLAEIVQSNLERINDANDEVDGVTVSLGELVELNVWRVSR